MEVGGEGEGNSARRNSRGLLVNAKHGVANGKAALFELGGKARVGAPQHLRGGLGDVLQKSIGDGGGVEWVAGVRMLRAKKK